MACNCKNCKDVTLFKGSDGVGVQHIEFNGCPTACDGTFTIFLTDGTTYTSPDLTGSTGANGISFKYVLQTVYTDPTDPPITITYANLTSCGAVPAPTCLGAGTIANAFLDYTIEVWARPTGVGPWRKDRDALVNVDATTGDLAITPTTSASTEDIRIVILG